MLEKGQIIDLKEGNLSVKNDGKVIHNELGIYIGVLPKENLKWFSEGSYDDVIRVVALNDFDAEYTTNIFSVKHLTNLINELNSYDAGVADELLRDMLEKVEELTKKVESLISE